ncbi:TetM/TetW/TetO/TetS family tetracycline resistance ribosomal protection protein [Dactylosporangium fulvum]|uniref:TetM/TetW/TetO/TetS family tetracycline resistance ribosomal protection protein n=1 Tax=Dactylosporangium fulvum TaxID=53359 RepID=A0ABY5VNY9_9ACTN|nr:TetM/TetW/TetO/TetS family tetracycline resistance ribosomal protection protein [Dactylosporangium fulvum]UWP78799.1 TetM/TetW/TetO/TetS family tetracycline resistance ribosomal protection protein [Dactylosporangium fulvum]
MPTLNLGILAHVDAGKTSLTERLLHAAGVIDEIGSVDDGSTRTDSLALERQRGITIKSAVVSFVVDGVDVNLIDTPGHPDFIAEVERVLSVLDGAVLVVSAVEGVQAQTRVLMRTLQRLRIPTIVFINKVDRRGADPGRVLREIAARLTPAVVPVDAGTTRIVEVLAEHDDALLAAYVGNHPVPDTRVREALARQARRALVHPVYTGSAITGDGVAELVAGIPAHLPTVDGDATGPVSGTVFKVERGPAGEKIAYVRMFSGAVRVRDRFRGEDRVTAVGVFDNGTVVRREAVTAGHIGKLWGLASVRIGDAIGVPPAGTGRQFAPPTLETVVVPARPGEKGALHAALAQLAEQDPLIDLRQDDVRQEVSVSLYGEVQKEVVQATLHDEYGLDVTFRETTTICVERPAGTGAAVEFIGVPPNPFLATVGLRVDPAPAGSGVAFRLEVELGSMPPAFFKAVEETVRETLGQGVHGWATTDCVVTMTHSGYWARQSHAHGTFDKSMSSTAGDFRNLTPLVLMDALRAAGTTVLEPVHRFRLEFPADTLSSVLPALVRARGVPLRNLPGLIEGDVPAANVHALQQVLPALTRGEGVLEYTFDRYEPVRGPVPERPRSDHNPLDRKEYLLQVVRRTAVGLG